MVLTVVEYVREDGPSPYRAWFDGLNAPAAAKVATAVYRLQWGNTSSVKWMGAFGEYRLNWGPGYRIYLAKDGAALMSCEAAEPRKDSSQTSTALKRSGRSTRLAKW